MLESQSRLDEPSSATPSPEQLEAFDASAVRKMLDEETAIRNGLSETTRGHLAAAMESGRYLLCIAYLQKVGDDLRLNVHHHRRDLPTPDQDRALRMFAAGMSERVQQSQTRVSDAIPDVGE